MKKSRFSESQIVATLKEGKAGVLVAQILRKHGDAQRWCERRRPTYDLGC